MIALYIILGVIALFFIIPLLLPGSYDVKKTTVINCPPEKVFDHVADLNHYHAWNPWARTEPAAAHKVEGAPKQPGHKYSWEGKKIGVGSLTLGKATPGKSVDFDLRFIKPFKSQADDLWSFEAKDGGTLVTWHNKGPLSYPMARMMGPMIKGQLNKQFEEGLRNLKQLCETGKV